MDTIALKTSFCLVLMIAFLILAFTTTSVITRELFSSLGLITIIYASKLISSQNKLKNE